jgi:hypothetical protein
MLFTTNATELLLLKVMVFAELLVPTATLPNESESVERVALWACTLGTTRSARARTSNSIETRVSQRANCAFMCDLEAKRVRFAANLG